MAVQAGSVGVQCPTCNEVINVPVNCEIINPDQAHERMAALVCTPDTTDLWAHVWSHDER